MDSLPLPPPRPRRPPVAPLGIGGPLPPAPAWASQGKPPAPPLSSVGPSLLRVEMRAYVLHPDRLGSGWGGVSSLCL